MGQSIALGALTSTENARYSHLRFWSRRLCWWRRISTRSSLASES